MTVLGRQLFAVKIVSNINNKHQKKNSFFTYWKAIWSKAHKKGNFGNSLKLSFVNVWGSCFTWEKLGRLNSNFSQRSFLPLIRKDSLTDIYGLVVYVKDRLPVCMGLIRRKLWGFLFKFLIDFTSFSALPLFLYQSSFSSLCKAFYAI